jgi:exopolysaccharide biosynthesis polyprenyl glycosylphosphotransferase
VNQFFIQSEMKSETVVEKKIEKKAAVSKVENRVPPFVLPLVKTLIFAADACLTVFCFTLAFRWREGAAVLSETAWIWSKEFEPYAGVLLFAVPCRLIMLSYQRVYRLQGAFSYTAEAIKIFKAVAVGSLLIVSWAFLFRGGFAFREFSYSRGVFLFDFALALLIFTIFHLALRRVQTFFRQRDINLIPTLIVGTNREAEQTIGELRMRPHLGYRVLGTITAEKGDELRITNDELRNNSNENESIRNPIGSLNDLPRLIRELEIQEVIITDDKIPSERFFEIMLEIGRRQKVEFRFAPSLFNVLPQKTSVEQIGVLPMVRLFREPLSDVEKFVKRAFDIMIAGAAIALLSPIWLIVSILVKLDSPGTVFFRQERVGMDGRVFLCYKFRTMLSDADDRIHREAYRKNIEGATEANAGDDEKPLFGKVKNDPRITRVGNWLRRSSLDELPQFLNVLRGEMSVVGARPPIPYEVEEYDPAHRRRLDMKPGITGLWQVSGRSRLSFEEMVRIDLYYIENWSLWLDLKIILLTLPAILRGDGAR